MNLLSLTFLIICAIGVVLASSKDKDKDKNKDKATCEIEGFKERGSSSKGYYYLDGEINDTFMGFITSLKTKNIERISSSVDYLNVTLQNSMLSFSTSDAFKDFEKNTSPHKDPQISVRLDMDCVKGGTLSKVYIYQNVKDTNNHPPIFNQEHYSYSFGMPIPEGLFLNEILPIFVTDYDVTNFGVNFLIDNNSENFKIISSRGSSSKYSNRHPVNLVTNRKLTAPFNETIVVTATDQGKPSRSTSAAITITISDPKDLENFAFTKNNKSPTFSKSVYFADYTLQNEILMEEFITLEHEASGNTHIKQNGYEEYFNVQFEDLNKKDINIKQITNLPEVIVNHFDSIAIEIEASVDFQVTSFTTLIIRLPNFGSKIMKQSVPTELQATQQCNTYFQNDYITQSYSIPLILFAIAVCCIIFINTYMIILFFNKKEKLVTST